VRLGRSIKYEHSIVWTHQQSQQSRRFPSPYYTFQHLSAKSILPSLFSVDILVSSCCCSSSVDHVHNDNIDSELSTMIQKDLDDTPSLPRSDAPQVVSKRALKPYTGPHALECACNEDCPACGGEAVCEVDVDGSHGNVLVCMCCTDGSFRPDEMPLIVAIPLRLLVLVGPILLWYFK
jgi:hypothetical protein